MVVLTQELEVLAIQKVDTNSFRTLIGMEGGGGGAQKVLPCLEGCVGGVQMIRTRKPIFNTLCIKFAFW